MVKKFDLKDLFADCETIPQANESNVKYTLVYGRNGEHLDLVLFHSEDEGDEEYHLNIFVVDGHDEIQDQISYDATALKPRVTQFSIDVIDENVNTERITRILRENGIEVCGIANDYGWEYDEYFN